MVLCITAKHLHFGIIFPKDIVPEVVVCSPKLCCRFLFREKKLSPGSPSKQAILVQPYSNCTVMNFNFLTCSPRHVTSEVHLLGLQFFWTLHSLLWWTCRDVHSWEDCQLYSFFFTCRMMDSKLFVTLTRLMGSNNCFSKILADVFLSWHCVNTPEYSRLTIFQSIGFYHDGHTCWWSTTLMQIMNSGSSESVFIHTLSCISVYFYKIINDAE